MNTTCPICQIYSHEYACTHVLEVSSASRKNSKVNKISSVPMSEKFSVVYERGVRMQLLQDDPIAVQLWSKRRVDDGAAFEKYFMRKKEKIIVPWNERCETYVRQLRTGFNLRNDMQLREMIERVVLVPSDVEQSIVVQHVTSREDITSVCKVLSRFSVGHCFGLVRSQNDMTELQTVEGYSVVVFDSGICGDAYFVVRDHQCVLDGVSVRRKSNVLEFVQTPEIKMRNYNNIGQKYFSLDVFKTERYRIDDKAYERVFSYIEKIQTEKETMSYVASDVIAEVLVNDVYVKNLEDIGTVEKFIAIGEFALCNSYYSEKDLLDQYELVLDRIIQIINKFEEEEEETVVSYEQPQKMDLMAHVAFSYGEVEEGREEEGDKEKEENNFDYINELKMVISCLLLKICRKETLNNSEVWDDIIYTNEILIEYGILTLKEHGVNVLADNGPFVVLRDRFRLYFKHKYKFWCDLAKNFTSFGNLSEIPYEYRHLILFKPRDRFRVLCMTGFLFYDDPKNVFATTMVVCSDYLVKNYEDLIKEWIETNKIVYTLSMKYHSVVKIKNYKDRDERLKF